jgi:hypothetical protein
LNDKEHLEGYDVNAEGNSQEEYDYYDHHLHLDLEEGGVYLKEAMEVDMVAFSFPIRTIMVLVFSYRTGRNYHIMNFNTVVDFCLFVGVLVWFLRYEYLIMLTPDEGMHFTHLQNMMWHLTEEIES